MLPVFRSSLYVMFMLCITPSRNPCAFNYGDVAIGRRKTLNRNIMRNFQFQRRNEETIKEFNRKFKD